MESDQRSRFLVWSHFLQRTGIHVVRKCSSKRDPMPLLQTNNSANTLVLRYHSLQEAMFDKSQQRNAAAQNNSRSNQVSRKFRQRRSN